MPLGYTTDIKTSKNFLLLERYFYFREACKFLQYRKKCLCYFVSRIACNVRLSAIFHYKFLLQEKNVQLLDRFTVA